MVSRLKDMLGITKIQNLKQIIEQNGGLKNSYKTLFRTDDLKLGRYVGTDEFGKFVVPIRGTIYSTRIGTLLYKCIIIKMIVRFRNYCS